jgi:hypothetical protein
VRRPWNRTLERPLPLSATPRPFDAAPEPWLQEPGTKLVLERQS